MQPAAERTARRAMSGKGGDVPRLPGSSSVRANRVWAPFDQGNKAAVTHGAYSPEMRMPRVQQLVTWVLAQDTLAHISDESFRPSLFRWAERQAMADLLFKALEKHHEKEVCPGCKRCRGWEERWQKFDRAAERAASAIGLDPMSRSELLARMNSSGLLNMADEAKSMLENLMIGLNGIVDLAMYVQELHALLQQAGVTYPEAPGIYESVLPRDDGWMDGLPVGGTVTELESGGVGE